MRTRTSPGPGPGIGRSTISSGAPTPLSTAARIVSPAPPAEPSWRCLRPLGDRMLDPKEARAARRCGGEVARGRGRVMARPELAPIAPAGQAATEAKAGIGCASRGEGATGEGFLRDDQAVFVADVCEREKRGGALLGREAGADADTR